MRITKTNSPKPLVKPSFFKILFATVCNRTLFLLFFKYFLFVIVNLLVTVNPLMFSPALMIGQPRIRARIRRPKIKPPMFPLMIYHFENGTSPNRIYLNIRLSI